jgi:hypothetical protein
MNNGLPAFVLFSSIIVFLYEPCVNQQPMGAGVYALARMIMRSDFLFEPLKFG